jgi:hypothetical protein
MSTFEDDERFDGLYMNVAQTARGKKWLRRKINAVTNIAYNKRVPVIVCRPLLDALRVKETTTTTTM